MGLMFIACALFGACAQAAVSGTIPAAAAVATTSPVPATTPAGMIACYNGPMETANTAYSMFPAQQDGAACVCASYQYKCSKGDTSCSAAEAALGTSKYAYIWTLAATCSTMASMPDVYSNVLCCSEDRCNKPDVAVDPTTKAMESPEVVNVASAVPTQPAPAVEKAAAVEAEELPATTVTSDSSNPAETVQMDPNAGGLPSDGVTTPQSSSVTFNGLAIAPVYSFKKEASVAATQSTAKSVSSADKESVGLIAFVVVGLLALVL